MSSCLLNSLPVELIHHLFEYFHSYEIIQSFFNVNEHLNRIVSNYDRYILDFRGILKSQFDLVCQFVQPNQVIYLRLHDDDTPEQCDIFFSRFHIEQFVNLRSLEIVSHRKNIEQYLINVSKLQRLSSIILPLTHRISSMVDIQKVFLQLHRLIIDSPESLNRKMPELRYLKLTKYERAPFPYLSNGHLMPNLRSLDITLSLKWILSTLNADSIWFQIKRLFLKTTDSDILLSMSQFLCKLTDLQHLEIDVQNATNVPDGQQWEPLVSHLITFDFRFTIYNKMIDGDTSEKHLKSFCSSFWLEEKHWFVGYYKNISSYSFFTVPRFIPTSIDTSFVYQPLSTSSNFSFDQYIRCITVSESFSDYARFSKLTSLIFGGKFDLNCKSEAFLNDLLRQLPHVHSLSFQNLQSTLYISILNNSVFNQIRSLMIRHTFPQSCFRLSFEPKKWCNVFPRVERLFASIDVTSDMFIFIDELKYLSIATFELNNWDKSQDWSYEPTREWLMKSSQRLRRNSNFTLLYSNEEVHLWMNEQQIIEHQSSSITSWCCLL